MKWNIVSVAMKGTTHMQNGEKCQDYIGRSLSNDFAYITLADGAGAVKYATEGAVTAAEETKRQLETLGESLFSMDVGEIRGWLLTNLREKFMEEYIATNRKGWLNFEPIITWKKGHNQAKEDIYERDSETGMPVRDMPPLFLKGDSFEEFVFPKDALRRIFNNIVSNAQAHGFTEETRKDYKLKFSWRSDETGLFIEIENNGTPIPTDRDTSSLLEYGVSTALHHDGHNGIGCNEIDDIMRRYDGDVHIISSPDSEYTVKYVLRFKQISTPILS